MKNVLGLILKKENVIIDGKKIEVLSYFTSMGTPKKIKSIKLTINNKAEEVRDIRDIETDNANYYYVRANTKQIVDDNLIDACNNRYKDSCFTIKEGKIVEIKDTNLLDKINNYINNKNINNIYNEITGNIIGQDEHVKSVMSSILWNNHLINSNINSNNISKNKDTILIMGKTGTGKTEIIKQIAEKLNLPIVIENAPSYALLDGDGSPIDKMLLDLIYITDGDMELAKKGILVIDNFDKLLTSNEHYGRITSDLTQKELFKLIDGDIRKFKYDDELITLDTHGLTIVLLGDFNFNDKVFGFDNKKEQRNIESKLLNLGFKRELLDRVNKIRTLNNLNKNDLIKILKSRESKLMNYISYLKNKGIDIKLDDEKLDIIANKAIKEGRGARSLNKIVDELIDIEFNSIKIKRREL